ncbi:hypothetical protein WOLCODRAFT_109823 [Wolfiporia cocos MD-104 SS10]|uniref:Large ribosomal subunit protein bL28m n=1 Tax=Wolfiporia cocos (strain MD-104) TaxID=742152 RepID=A0A2H3J5E2_WOLCO|nr:hypothetical protein WOLCODRAFT_109823 [Wolfiporia cocos MD-104 SS10]
MFPSTVLLKEIISTPFKRSQRGLFHGKMKQFGNNNPFSKKKTRRDWLPNVQSKRLFSDTMQEFLKLKVTTRALKTINKYGGIDEYLLKTKPDLLGWEGMRLRIMIRERRHANAKTIGALPAPEAITAPSVSEATSAPSAS